MAKAYHDYYPWQTYSGDYAIGHADGVVSVMFAWEGMDNTFYSDAEHQLELNRRIELLRHRDEHVFIEHHFWRERDDRVINDYLQHANNMVRGEHFARPVKDAMAEHLRNHSRSNRVATVLSLSASSKLGFLKSKSTRIADGWKKAEELLLEKVQELIDSYPGARLLSKDEYSQCLVRSYRDDQEPVEMDYRFDIGEQVAYPKPQLVEEGALKIGDLYTKVVLVYGYPNFEPTWFFGICQADIDIHVSQIIEPISTSNALDKSAERSDADTETMGKKGRDLTANAINNAGGFRQYVVNNNLTICRNAYIIHFRDASLDAVLTAERNLRKWIQVNGGGVRSDADLQAHFFRVAQPGLGRYSKFLREDHSAAIAAMMPFTVFDTGVAAPESIRITSSGQVVGHAPSRLEAGHEICVAKTGAGKDTQQGTEVIETFPHGLNYYILEFGDSYKWVVEGFGGTYTRINPEENYINPLPAYDCVVKNSELPLPSLQVSGTVEGISIVLLDEVRDLTQAEQAAAEHALQNLYRTVEPGKIAPTLPKLYESFECCDFANDEQRRVGKEMADRLYNFLDNSNGRPFRNEDNLQISTEITGVDLQAVDKKMLKFYLNFITLRFANMAFFQLDQVAKVILNELHIPMEAAPGVTSRLVRTLNRMGRKDGAQSGLITQGMKEIKAIDEEVFSSSPIRTLLVREDEWEAIGEKLSMPPAAVNIWKGYNTNLENQPFRQCMRRMGGKYYDLHLTFPQIALDVTSTTRSDRVIKRSVEKQTTDVFERIRLFNEMKQERARA